MASMPAPGTRYRRVDQYDARQAGGTAERGANGDPCAHGMPDNGIILQTERAGESDRILRLCIQAVVKIGRSLRQTTSANIENINIEGRAEPLADKTPCDRWAGDAWKQNDRVAPGTRAAIT